MACAEKSVRLVVIHEIPKTSAALDARKQSCSQSHPFRSAFQGLVSGNFHAPYNWTVNSNEKSCERANWLQSRKSSQASSNEADMLANGINFALPGLTRRRSFDVMSFANCFLFCTGKDEGFIEMKLDDEFYFAPANQIYRIFGTPLRRKRNLNLFWTI